MLICCTDLRGKNEVDEKYLRNRLAPKIADHWVNVAIQLAVENPNTFEPFVNLTEERFRRMLLCWLQSNKDKKTLDEIFATFEQALKNLKLNKCAEEFSENVKEYKQRSVTEIN